MRDLLSEPDADVSPDIGTPKLTDRFHGWAGRDTRNLPKGACGYTFCPAPIRMFWLCPDAPEYKVRQSWLGCSHSVMHKRAERLGLPPSKRGHKFVAVSARRLRETWADETLSLSQAAASLGLNPRVLQNRARSLGLPPRKFGPHPKPLAADFTDLWRAGVRVDDIATACGMSRSNVRRRAKKEGLPMRQRGVLGVPIATYRAGHDEDLARYGLPKSFDEMWRAGVSAADLGKAISRHKSSIEKAAKKRGLPPRPVGKPRITVAQFLFARTAQQVSANMRNAEMVDKLYTPRQPAQVAP